GGLAPYVRVGVLAALLAATPALADSPIATKRAEAELVWAQIQRLDVSLGQADERLNLANINLARVKKDLALNRRQLRVARHNLRRSEKVIAHRLVTLYTTPEISTLEVLLGASSVDEMLKRADTANRVSALDAEVLSQVKTFKSAVQRYGRALERRVRTLGGWWRSAQRKSRRSRSSSPSGGACRCRQLGFRTSTRIADFCVMAVCLWVGDG